MSKERLLVCISSSPSSWKTVEAAGKLAGQLRAHLTALYVENPEKGSLSALEKASLEHARRTAEQYHAFFIRTYDSDPAYGIAQYATTSGFTKIVIGQTKETGGSLVHHQSLSSRISAYAPSLQVVIIPDPDWEPSEIRRAVVLRRPSLSLVDLLAVVILPVLATLAGFLFASLHMSDSNIIPLYLLAAMLVSLVASHWIYGVAASVLSVFLFNFFFIEPLQSLRFFDPQYFVTFIVMFASSLLTSFLASRIKENAMRSAENGYRTRTLLQTNQLLQKAETSQEISDAAASQIRKLTGQSVVVYMKEKNHLGQARVYAADPEERRASWLSEEEKEAAEWSFENRKICGKGTAVYRDRELFYAAICVHESSFGTVGFHMSAAEMDPYTFSLLIAEINEWALALEAKKNAEEKEAAAVDAKNQQIRADLLRSISHDLRTPLTSIYGNASNLLESEKQMSPQMRRSIYTDIQSDSQWLIDTVQNLLAITRIENGTPVLNLQVELMDEVVDEAMRHISADASEHNIRVSCADEIMLVRMDAGLIVQVIVNLVNNAIKYTQKDSEILVSCDCDDAHVYLRVSDNGPGIDPESAGHVFEMFWTGHHKVADARRSMGLGLALCRPIMELHGGTIELQSNQPHGCIFTCTFKREEAENCESTSDTGSGR